MNSVTADLVSVIVVNWNGERYIRRCLSCLMKQTYPNMEVILVDNDSKDSSLAVVRKYFPEVRLIRLDRNYGFPKANNIALDQAKGEFICLLNNDAFPERNWVEELVKTIKNYPEAAAVASKMLNDHHREIIDSAGDGYSRMAWPDKIGFGVKDDGNYDRIREVISVCAGAALYRRSVLDTIGFLDDDLFFSMEDVDLSLRINLAGYRCVYVPTAVVYHISSGSTGSRRNPFTIYWSTRNYLLVIIKNLPAKLTLRYLPLIFAFQFYWIIASMKEKVLSAYLRGMVDSFHPKMFMLMLRKRKRLKQSWRLSAREFHRRIVTSEREILEGIYQKRVFQGRPSGDVKACLKILHGRDAWSNL